MGESEEKCRERLRDFSEDVVYRKAFNLGDIQGIHKWMISCGIPRKIGIELLLQMVQQLRRNDEKV